MAESTRAAASLDGDIANFANLKLDESKVTSGQAEEGLTKPTAPGHIATYKKNEVAPLDESPGQEFDIALKKSIKGILSVMSNDMEPARRVVLVDKLKDTLRQFVIMGRAEAGAVEDITEQLKVKVITVPFSDATPDALQSIGITDHDKVNQFQGIIDNNLDVQLRDDINKYWAPNGAHKDLLYDVRGLSTLLTIGSRDSYSTVAAKATVNRVLLSVFDLFHGEFKTNYHATEALHFKTCPGQVNGDAMFSAALPIYSEDPNKVVLFSGSKQYIAPLKFKWSATEPQNHSIVKELEEAYKQGSDVLTNTEHGLFILFVEEKGSKTLANYEPQLIAEAIAGVTMSYKGLLAEGFGDMAKLTIAQSYCLTDSTDWVFGMVTYNCRNGKWRNTRIAEVKNNGKDFEALKLLMTIIVALITLKPDTLLPDWHDLE